MDIKEIIAKNLPKFDGVDLKDLITETVDKRMGDYSIACFSLAKSLKKSPMIIAEEIKNNFGKCDIVEKFEIVGGYVNFFLKKDICIKNILQEIADDKFFDTFKNGDGKRICIDYSSVNLAKYMHIGHLSTTIIGECLARIFENMGYEVVRINYIGDYGTPFGKMLYAHLAWGNDEDLNSRGVDYLQDMYVEFYKRAEEDETLEEYAREYFKKICEKDEKVYPIYQKIIEISKVEAERILNMLDVHFDSWKGESAYGDELNTVVSLLEDKKLLVESQGAKVVDLEKFELGTCLIQKSDGTSLYAARDISACIDRFNTYHFDKMIYVTAVQQKLHFQQFFKVLELLGYDFSKNLEHVYYGMFSLSTTGTIASRKGKQAVLTDLMKYAYDKVYDIIKDRGFSEEKKDEIAKKIAYSALKFTPIKTERIKDTVFDEENAFSFDGDTSAYLQYTYARICSILRKGNNYNPANVDFSKINSDNVASIALMMNNFGSTLNKAMEMEEPSILCKYTLDLCKLFNKFYTQERVVTDNEEETNAKLYLLQNIKKLLTKLFHLICIETIEEM